MDLTKKQKTLIGVVFGVYMAILIYVLFFSARFGRTQGNVHGVNLVPLNEIKRFYKGPESLATGLFWLNIAGNIAAFLPMGLLVALLAPRKPYGVFAVAAVYVASMVAEVLQYVFKVGSFDIDDVLLNTIGGLIGVLISIPVRRKLAGKPKRKSRKKR